MPGYLLELFRQWKMLVNTVGKVRAVAYITELALFASVAKRLDLAEAGFTMCTGAPADVLAATM